METRLDENVPTIKSEDLSRIKSELLLIVNTLNELIKSISSNDLMSNKNEITETIQSIVEAIYRLNIGNGNFNFLEVLYNQADLPTLHIDNEKLLNKTLDSTLFEISQGSKRLAKNHKDNVLIKQLISSCNKIVKIMEQSGLIKFNQMQESAKKLQVSNVISKLSLPEEIYLEIFKYSSVRTLGRVARVCKGFNRISQKDFLWKDRFQKDFEKYATSKGIEWSYKEAYKIFSEPAEKCYLICQFAKEKIVNIGKDIITHWEQVSDIQKKEISAHLSKDEALEVIKKMYAKKLDPSNLFFKTNQRLFIIGVKLDINCARAFLIPDKTAPYKYGVIPCYFMSIQEYDVNTNQLKDVIIVNSNFKIGEFIIKNENEDIEKFHPSPKK